jgi:hypothetical protein
MTTRSITGSADHAHVTHRIADLRDQYAKLSQRDTLNREQITIGK